MATKRARHRVEEHDDDHDRKHRRHGHAGDDAFATVNPVQIAGNLSNLAYAWAQASTEMWVGAAQVFGHFVMNMNEDLFYGVPRPGGPRGSTRDRDDSSSDEPGDDRDHAPRRRSVVTQRFADNLGEALEETSDVFARSAERFTHSYESSSGRHADTTATDDDLDEERKARAKKREADAEARKDE